MHENTDLPQDDSKSSLRTELRKRRRGLSSSVRATYDRAIRQHVLELIKSQDADSIACHWPFNGEPDIKPLCRQLLADGHKLALPVVSGKNDHMMQFHSWRPNTTLAKNRYGIFEPRESTVVSLSSVDILIMPLVAYDREGNRLGMGSGYYDRHLESLRDLQKPLRVGVAYSLQEIDLIDGNKWDIPLHGVVNERGWFTFVDRQF